MGIARDENDAVIIDMALKTWWSFEEVRYWYEVVSGVDLGTKGRYGEKAIGLRRKGQAVGFERCERWGIRDFSGEEGRGMGCILGWTFVVDFPA